MRFGRISYRREAGSAANGRHGLPRACDDPKMTGASISSAAGAALQEVLDREDPSIVGIILTGSAACGLATTRSDVDVIVVRDGERGDRDVTRSATIDEIPLTLAELEDVPPVGSESAWGGGSSLGVRSSATGRAAESARRRIVSRRSLSRRPGACFSVCPGSTASSTSPTAH